MKLHLFIPPELERASSPVISMLKSYCTNFGLHIVRQMESADAVIFYGRYFEVNKPTVFIPHIPSHFQPNKTITSYKNSLPLPENSNYYVEESRMVFTGDLFAFLAGQLFRVEEQKPLELENETTELLGERQNLFNTPFVDEWFLFLFNFLFPKPVQSIWSTEGPSIWLTHDVDNLQYWNFKKALWHSFKSPKKLLDPEGPQHWKTIFNSLLRGIDPRNCIEQILEIEKGLPSDFFFLGLPLDHIGKRYDLNHHRFKKALLAIKNSKAKANLHGSPLHLKNPLLFKEEAHNFQEAFAEAPVCNRFHYLSWDPKMSPQLLVKHGFSLDTTMGFNTRSGFRNGTALPFKWYSFHEARELHFIEVPFQLADHQCHGLLKEGPEGFEEQFEYYEKKVAKVQGIFTVLFHNMYFSGIEYPHFAEMYQNLIHKNAEQRVYRSSQEIIDIFRKHESNY